MKICGVVPVYNHPATIEMVARSLLDLGLHCILVDDGSDPFCAQVLVDLTAKFEGRIDLIRLKVNGGKGAAITTGFRHALRNGFSHALQIDADGQHDIKDLNKFIEAAKSHASSVICGVPIYDESVPKARFYGRYLTHVWVWINTLSFEIRDSMCGFRVYPLLPTVEIMDRFNIGSRMDFDIEILVRLHWQGLTFFNIPTFVHYPSDGVSHFRAWGDNVLISKMHARLFFGMMVRLPKIIWHKCRRMLV